MEREKFQGYVASLEQIMKNTHFDLREAMDQFHELCLRVTPERIVPVGIITDIRQTYKEIQDQLTKIRGANQLLEGKPRCCIKFGAWIYPVRNNAPLSFESRYSGTGISNGVNPTLTQRGMAVKSMSSPGSIQE